MKARAEELKAEKKLKILKDPKYEKMIDYEDAEEAIQRAGNINIPSSINLA